ncbi:MAG TPA: SIMPL domain-containing protein [Gemmatimonadales bacterium]|nr:SIMPL domain-containing protein [Gemmatimonadales bacterium]
MAMERPLGSLIIAAGLALAGLLAGVGLSRSRANDRYVTVKGISEREAQADLAIWPLRVSAADNDLARAHAQLEASITRIRQFLVRNRIDTAQMTRQDFRVTDAYTNQYGGAELVSAGVVLSSGEEFGDGGPTFVFTGLSRLKPEMIAEATARARKAAEQFARDSRSTLGGIRRANQGIFEILPRDQAPGISEASQIVKTVRVVTTVEYFLR